LELQHLASYQRCTERIRANWPAFRSRRDERLRQQERQGAAAEKVTENIVEDLLTIPLDWQLGDLNNQVQYADLLLTRLGIKYLIIETKRPGVLAWNQHAVQVALAQARRYADEQKVRCVGVSDGVMFYAADVQGGGLQDRVFVPLVADEPPLDLWWISEHGIYRPHVEPTGAAPELLPHVEPAGQGELPLDAPGLLHPQYRLPAECFAYVGDASDPRTWKLPYLLADGQIDGKRLPKAVQAVITNYRGTKVSGIPEAHIPDVLMRLAQAAERSGKMPHQCGKTAAVYELLAEVLEQIGQARA
jgi:hypothetical protein